MLLHPTTIILASMLILIISQKNDRIFKIIAILSPIVAALVFFTQAENGSITLATITFSFEFSDYTKLISISFFCVLLAANLYSLGQNKKLEIIFGSSYCAFAMLCLFASDFISMFIGLELMMIASTIIIFIGGNRASLSCAKKYFITHLTSSNMILIGVAHLVTKNNNLSIVPVTELLTDPNYSLPIIYIMLTGMFINIASFPFSGWMVNYYTKASPSGFLYLISFTTKVSIMLILKVFPSLEIMKYAAIIMIFYSSLKASKEENLFSLLCYLSIMSIGFMLLGVSIGSTEALLATSCYLFLHIIYKSLLSILAAILADEVRIIKCNEIKKINNKLMYFGAIIAILIMTNTPLTSSFYIKYALSHMMEDNLAYYTVIFLTFMTVYVIPWKLYYKAEETVKIKLNIYSKLSLIFMIFVLIIIGFAGFYLPLINEINTFQKIALFGIDSLKQTTIIIIALIISYLFIATRINTKPINFTEDTARLILGLYINMLEKREKKKAASEPWEIKSAETQILNRIQEKHTQQIAIFVTFAILVMALLIFTAK